MTASFSTCANSVTPASRILSPPIPASENGAPISPSARATPAPCRSPEASPATNRISRTCSSRRASPSLPGERRQRALDVGDDLERHREGLASFLSRHRDWRLAPHCGNEALELQPERLRLLRAQRNAFDELLELDRRRGERHDIHVAAQAEELSLPAPQVEREITALLEDPQLAHPLARDAARRDVRHGARGKRQAGIRDVDERRQHGHAD